MFLFLNVVCFASEYDFTIDSVLLNTDIPKQIIDNDVSTFYNIPDYEYIHTFNFKECSLAGYFIKYVGTNHGYFVKDSKRVDYVVKRTYQADGGTYVIFDNSILVDGYRFYIDCGVCCGYVHEFEIFTDPQVVFVLVESASDSLKLQYRVSGIDVIEKYELYLNDSLIETTNSTEYEFTGLEAGVKYNIKIRAFIGSDVYEGEYVYKADNLKLELVSCNRTAQLNVNDSIVYKFNKSIDSISNYTDYVINENLLTINLSNDYEEAVTINYTVTDLDGETLEVKQDFVTIKKGEMFSSFDFGFVAEWVNDLFCTLRGNAKTVLLLGLGLLALIVGAFFFFFLGKKAVKKSK